MIKLAGETSPAPWWAGGGIFLLQGPPVNLDFVVGVPGCAPELPQCGPGFVEDAPGGSLLGVVEARLPGAQVLLVECFEALALAPEVYDNDLDGERTEYITEALGRSGVNLRTSLENDLQKGQLLDALVHG